MTGHLRDLRCMRWDSLKWLLSWMALASWFRYARRLLLFSFQLRDKPAIDYCWMLSDAMFLLMRLQVCVVITGGCVVTPHIRWGSAWVRLHWSWAKYVLFYGNVITPIWWAYDETFIKMAFVATIRVYWWCFIIDSDGEMNTALKMPVEMRYFRHLHDYG